MYSVKRAGQFGGGLQGGVTVCPQRKPSLHASFHSPSLIFMIIGMRSEAAGTLGGWREALRIGGGGGGVRLSTPPFFSEASFLLLLSTSVSPQTGQQPETGLRLSVATSSWPECVWRARAGWTPQLRHAPLKIAWIIYGKRLLSASLKRWCL